MSNCIFKSSHVRGIFKNIKNQEKPLKLQYVLSASVGEAGSTIVQ